MYFKKIDEIHIYDKINNSTIKDWGQLNLNLQNNYFRFFIEQL